MSQHAFVQRNKPGVADASLASGILQRQCACGQHTVSGGECEACRNKRTTLQRKAIGSRGSSLSVNQPGDRFEQEADRMAAFVVAQPGPARHPGPASSRPGGTLQRQDPPAKGKSDEEKYKEAAKKTGEAFLKTETGKKIEEKAKELGEEFVSTLPGKVVAGTAAVGAVTAIVATNSELPIQVPAIPLDIIYPSLEMKIEVEGPVRNPTKAMITFSGKFGARSGPKKPAKTRAEKQREANIKLERELYEFRQSLRTPEEKARDEAFMQQYILRQTRDPSSALYIPGLAPRQEVPEAAKKKEEETPVQRKAVTGEQQPVAAPPIVHDVLSGPGQALDPTTRSFMESRFGYDFSHVRVHADARAAESAEAVAARAYTVGRDVVFGSGLYDPASSAGKELLAHELTHVVQQQGVSIPGSGIEHEQSARSVTRLAYPILQRQPAAQPSRDQVCLTSAARRQRRGRGRVVPACDPWSPHLCATYELWINSFTQLRSFRSRDTAPGGASPTGFEVIGAGRADLSANAPSADAPPPPVGPRVSDRFVDRPTDTWVQRCLPPTLREVAYRLPSDCADIAVILRHVWLVAHRRTETYNGGRDARGRRRTWVVGDQAGNAARARIGRVIGEVYSGNLERTVSAYSDETGRPIRSFADLQNMLHPGDILVWDHHDNGLNRPRTGGHSQTIESTTRDSSGNITRMTLLQGNQPIFQRQAQEIRQNIGRGAPSESQLRSAPGRRIERNRMSIGGDLRDMNNIWTWSDGHTTLRVAGPPAAARRPRARRQRGRRVRRISDWFQALRRASASSLQGIFEASLLETRGMIEGGRAPSNADAQALAEAAGEKVWRLARRAVNRRRDLGDRAHFDRLNRMKAMIRALGGIEPPMPNPTPNSRQVQRIFTLMDATFTQAARGMTSINLTRRVGRRTRVLKFLVTGFDPFTGVSVPPAVGAWNPSGAAALALDGKTIRVESGVKAAVEGVVFPVSYEAFRGNIVEDVVARAETQNVDAVITTSMDARIGGQGPVRIEQFAVGVHNLVPLQTHRLAAPEVPGQTGLQAIPAAAQGQRGPAIIRSTVDAAQLSQTLGSSDGSALATPGIGIRFRFADRRTATNALNALGLSAQASANTSATVVINDMNALNRITNTMQRLSSGVDIRFSANRQQFTTTIVAGPGGSFLSNEVSFRVLRQLQQNQREQRPVSFHVHTPGGPTIPQGGNIRAVRRQAFSILDRLLSTLRSIIRAVARQILARRRTSSSSTRP